jgi:hypothetical protein
MYPKGIHCRIGHLWKGSRPVVRPEVRHFRITAYLHLRSPWGMLQTSAPPNWRDYPTRGTGIKAVPWYRVMPPCAEAMSRG